MLKIETSGGQNLLQQILSNRWKVQIVSADSMCTFYILFAAGLFTKPPETSK